MSDTNLDPSITALTNRASTVAVTATARELMNISRLAPSLEKTENTDLEVAINARAEDLAPTATATELKSIGKAIGNVLEADTFVAGGTLPNQAQNSGNFLATNGTAESWGGLSVSTLSEVNISSIMNDETLVYNHVSGLFENNSEVFRIQEIALTENIPASGSFEGQVVFDQQTSELKYWDGSEWKVAAVVASGGGTSTVDWLSIDWNTPEFYVQRGGIRYGRAVAISGDYFAVVDDEMQISSGYNEPGAIYIYSSSDGQLLHTVEGNDNYTRYGAQYERGNNIAAAGDLLAFGGTKYKFTLVQLSTGNILKEIAGTNDNDYGTGVAFNEDGSKLVVGIGYESGPNSRVEIYDVSDINNISNTPMITIDPPNSRADGSGEFGFTVDITENTVIVGCPRALNDPQTSRPGRVFVYDISGGSAVLQLTIENPFQDGVGKFATSVSISGGDLSGGNTVIAVSDPFRPTTVYEGGYVYTYDSTGSLLATIIPPSSEGTHLNFGGRVRIVGDTLFISARGAGVGSYNGKLFVYSKDGTQLASSPSGSGSFSYGLDVDTTTGKVVVSEFTTKKIFMYQAPVTGSGASTVGSVSFLGNQDETLMVEASSSHFHFGTGDFTIEFWMKVPSIDTSTGAFGYHTLLDHGYRDTRDNEGSWWAVHQFNDTLVWWNDSGTVVSNSFITPDTWHHVAITRTGTTTEIYADGVSQGSGFDNQDYSDSVVRVLDIGTQTVKNANGSINFVRDYEGYISNLRIVKGTAVYTSNNFTPPTEELTAIAGTVLLCCTTQDDILFEATGKTISASSPAPTASTDAPL